SLIEPYRRCCVGTVRRRTSYLLHDVVADFLPLRPPLIRRLGFRSNALRPYEEDDWLMLWQTTATYDHLDELDVGFGSSS
ncbi:hypothetical protein LINPERPRIM_LOCUS8670, partial [Linum perenne]